MSIYDKWNKSIDNEALKKDIKEVEENGGGDYPEIPYGDYEVKVEKMELKECKSDKNKGMPMFAAQFKILEGQYKGNLIFMNQLITQGFQIHIVNEFLRSLATGLDVEFVDYHQYNELLLDIAEAIESQSLEYLLSYQQNKKGYNVFEIEEVFEADA